MVAPSLTDASPGLTTVAQIITKLKHKYPARQSQIQLLAGYLASLHAADLPFFVAGPAGAGKTSIVRELISELDLTHAYIDCHESTHPKYVLNSIIHQLKGHKRKRLDGYGSLTRCDTIAAFLETLPAALARLKSGTAWIVLDAAHRLAGSDLLSSLVRIQDSVGAPVGVIAISDVPWDSGRFLRDTHSVLQPVCITFPSYRPAELERILLQRLPRDDDVATMSTYRQFLAAVVPALSRASSCIYDLQSAVEHLWPLYSAPLRAQAATRPTPPALHARIRTELQRMISELEMGSGLLNVAALGACDGSGCGPPNDNSRAGIVVPGQATVGDGNTTSHDDARAGDRKRAPPPAAAIAGSERRASSQGLAFELPYVSKFLLLASYIASRNKPTTDRAIFDPGFSSGRGRRDAKASDRRAEAAQTAEFKEPHAFPLERLLHIFYCIYEQYGPEACSQEMDDQEGSDGDWNAAALRRRLAHEVQRAEVCMQVSTLVSLGLLSCGCANVLDGAQYRCHVATDLAEALASNVRMRLSDYLKLV